MKVLVSIQMVLILGLAGLTLFLTSANEAAINQANQAVMKLQTMVELPDETGVNQATKQELANISGTLSTIEQNLEFFSKKVSMIELQLPQTDLCTAEPNVTDIGSTQLPIDHKYTGIGFLGQIFTAQSCGEERVEQVYGVENGTYTRGITLTLAQAPSAQLLAQLQALSFTCQEEEKTAETCTWWTQTNDILIEDIMTLEPYHAEIVNDDCINCG